MNSFASPHLFAHNLQQQKLIAAKKNGIAGKVQAQGQGQAMDGIKKK